MKTFRGDSDNRVLIVIEAEASTQNVRIRAVVITPILKADHSRVADAIRVIALIEGAATCGVDSQQREVIGIYQQRFRPSGLIGCRDIGVYGIKPGEALKDVGALLVIEEL